MRSGKFDHSKRRPVTSFERILYTDLKRRPVRLFAIHQDASSCTDHCSGYTLFFKDSQDFIKINPFSYSSKINDIPVFKRSFNISFSEAFTPSGVTPYSGSYEAIPRVTAQSLPTRDRWLDRDVVIQAIPYHEVENTERGNTAIIGGI